MRLEFPGEREPADVSPRQTPAREECHPERVCPTCGATLLERKCKLLCPDPACGYYMSCSDFY
jgi:hypothetical protein